MTREEKYKLYKEFQWVVNNQKQEMRDFAIKNGIDVEIAELAIMQDEDIQRAERSLNRIKEITKWE